MTHKVLFDDGSHQWIAFGRDPDKPDSVIDTNEYLLINGGEGMLLDPGGTEIFPTVLGDVSKHIQLNRLTKYLCSHQDPDIMSSLPLWMALTPQASVYVSWIWSKFISHFGTSFVSKFIEVPDEGMGIRLGNQDLQIVPAHYCHSSGNLNLYDPRARVLFSGDIGSALVPDRYPFFVEDFEAHIRFMETFHVRWLPSNEAKNRWIRRVRNLDIDMLCPQHGAIFKGKDVTRFLNWLEDLEVAKTRG